MIGLDTNVLLRILIEDDAAQSERARRYFQSVTTDSPAIINPIVLVELVWTLTKSIKLGKAKVAELIAAVLSSDDLKVMHHGSAMRALAAYKSGNADFSDYFLALINTEMGCSATATFDDKALTFSSFTPVP
jgi:predicted nucleic-acid-binding protein